MDLPIKFPSETEVILEDVARSRALTPEERIQSLRSLLRAGTHLRRISPKAAWADEYNESQERLAQRNIREFFSRHGVECESYGVERESHSDGLMRVVESISESCAARSIRYAFIGELATIMRGWGQLTNRVEVLIEVPQTALPALLDDLVGRGFTLDPAVVIRDYVEGNITAFSFGAVRIDWLKPILPLHARALADAEPMYSSEGHSICVAKAEGLILTKMVTFRSQDQMDIDVLLSANRDAIDVGLIREEWAPFAATEPERTAWLDAAIARRVDRRE